MQKTLAFDPLVEYKVGIVVSNNHPRMRGPSETAIPPDEEPLTIDLNTRSVSRYNRKQTITRLVGE